MCFKKRTAPACIVGTMSILGIIAGILMIWLSFKLNGSDMLKEIENVEDLKNQYDLGAIKKMVFFALLIFSFVVLIASVMGILACKIKNRCYTVCYGLLLLPTWIVVLVMGIVASYAAVKSEDAVQSTCSSSLAKIAAAQSKVISGSSIPGCDGYPSSIEINLDIYEALRIDQNMCSGNCPCVKVSDPNPWVTSASAISQPRPVNSYDFTGTITDYKTCIIAPPVRASSCFKSFANALVNNKNWENIKSLLTFFEATYNCAGVCEASLFAFSKPVTDGKPVRSCVIGLKDAMGTEFRGLGLVALLSGILLFIIFIFQYCLWKKY